MSEYITPNAIDRVEILTLQDNYIEITAMDNNEIISRATAFAGGELKNSIQAEHGYSAIVKTTTDDRTRTLLFDFGFSDEGAAYNARLLNVDPETIEQMALSHGHMDHFGGFHELVKMIGKKGIELVVHPGVFKQPRYLKFGETLKAHFPKFTKAEVEQAGVKVVETAEPYSLLGGDAIFLGEIKRETDFEKGFPIAFFEQDGVETWDPIEDDTSVVMNVKGKGLVILSGCAHAGIINTVNHAQAVTGINDVYVVMGGFHLSGPMFEPIIGRTTDELKKINPTYVVPCHCTGRNAIMNMEKEMPDSFVLNMSGTKLTFSA
ncbi:MAG: MBL fold metallo-hydrolase [Deltaproteobacteria bacterium]|nr:MBL fold metallo-hydrolase [Deltaproteobacteria bacterium]